MEEKDGAKGKKKSNFAEYLYCIGLTKANNDCDEVTGKRSGEKAQNVMCSFSVFGASIALLLLLLLLPMLLLLLYTPTKSSRYLSSVYFSPRKYHTENLFPS